MSAPVIEQSLEPCRACGAECRVEVFGPGEHLVKPATIWVCSRNALFGRGGCPDTQAYLSAEAWNTRIEALAHRTPADIAGLVDLTVSNADATRFLESACRNWQDLRINSDDIADVAGSLAAFLRLRATALSSHAADIDSGGRPRSASSSISRAHSELEPDGQGQANRSPDRQGGGSREVGGRPAVLAGGLQCGERTVQPQGGEKLTDQVDGSEGSSTTPAADIAERDAAIDGLLKWADNVMQANGINPAKQKAVERARRAIEGGGCSTAAEPRTDPKDAELAMPEWPYADRPQFDSSEIRRFRGREWVPLELAESKLQWWQERDWQHSWAAPPAAVVAQIVALREALTELLEVSESPLYRPAMKRDAEQRARQALAGDYLTTPVEPGERS